MSKGPTIIVISVIALLLVIGLLGEVSLRSFTCMACHQQQAAYVDWMKSRLTSDNRGFSHELVACADCHIEGSPRNTVASRFRGLLHVASYFVPQIDPRKPQISGLFYKTRVPSDNCKTCHYAAIFRKTVYKRDMAPGALREIGLQMDHRKHVLARENTCSKCHERFKDQDALRADRDVNYAEVNHMSCDSCHSLAAHSFRAGQIQPMTVGQFASARDEAWDKLSANPRWMVSFPAESTCRRCHNGQIHYKTRIFKSECRESYNLENCLKCHPTMTPEWLDNYKKKRETRTFAARGVSNKFGEDINAVFENRSKGIYREFHDSNRGIAGSALR